LISINGNALGLIPIMLGIEAFKFLLKRRLKKTESVKLTTGGKNED